MIKRIMLFVEVVGRYLTTNRFEPHVKQKCDRWGNCYWQIYDPLTGFESCFSSEQEVREWLERRYYG